MTSSNFKRLSMYDFLQAVYDHGFDAYNQLRAEGYHSKVIINKAEKAVAKGYTGFDNWVGKAWITPKGTEFLENMAVRPKPAEQVVYSFDIYPEFSDETLRLYYGINLPSVWEQARQAEQERARRWRELVDRINRQVQELAAEAQLRQTANMWLLDASLPQLAPEPEGWTVARTAAGTPTFDLWWHKLGDAQAEYRGPQGDPGSFAPNPRSLWSIAGIPLELFDLSWMAIPKAYYYEDGLRGWPLTTCNCGICKMGR